MDRDRRHPTGSPEAVRAVRGVSVFEDSPFASAPRGILPRLWSTIHPLAVRSAMRHSCGPKQRAQLGLDLAWDRGLTHDEHVGGCPSNLIRLPGPNHAPDMVPPPGPPSEQGFPNNPRRRRSALDYQSSMMFERTHWIGDRTVPVGSTIDQWLPSVPSLAAPGRLGQATQRLVSETNSAYRTCTLDGISRGAKPRGGSSGLGGSASLSPWRRDTHG